MIVASPLIGLALMAGAFARLHSNPDPWLNPRLLRRHTALSYFGLAAPDDSLIVGGRHGSYYAT